MADLLGFTAISIVSIITLIMALRWPGISNILIVALIIRIFLLLIGHYIIALPGSTADAVGFEERAWDLGREGFFYVLNNFDFHPLIFFSWFHAIPYSLFGRSILMAQSIGLLFGIGSVFLGWKLAKLLWDKRIANKVGWTIALFPSLVLHSILFLREVYISFFLLLAVYGMVNWIKTNSFKSIILSLTGFIGATLFHGAMFVGAIIFIIIATTTYLKKLFKSLINLRINFEVLTIFLLFIIILGFYLLSKIKFYYLGSFEETINFEFLLEKMHNSNIGDASWPEWTIATSEIELFYKAPLRVIYFIFSPFPWDIKKPEHLIGLLDSLLYMYLSFLIFCNIKVIWRDPVLRIILIILLFYIFVFGIGVGNFGTSLRHKSKFTFMFILLAAPLIKSLVFFKKSIKVK
jgi:4-amino-4-deoxy-L-arabinose transferase-like glycosyltransferase